MFSFDDATPPGRGPSLAQEGLSKTRQMPGKREWKGLEFRAIAKCDEFITKRDSIYYEKRQ